MRSNYQVALLAEGVDRNGYQEAWADYRMKSPSSRRAWIEIAIKDELAGTFGSPSSRRAWIEMSLIASSAVISRVALLAEGVDRNARFGEKILFA